MRITMTAEEKIAFVINKIIEESQISPNPLLIKYEFTPVPSDNVSADDELKILQKFEKKCKLFFPKANFILEAMPDQEIIKIKNIIDREVFDDSKMKGFIELRLLQDFLRDIRKQKLDKLLPEKTKKRKGTTLYLTQNGDLYREPKEKYCYPMGEKGNRHKIIRFLVMNKGYQFTEFISTELGIESEKTIRTEIGKIRNNIKKYLKIDGKDFLQGKKESGYRINPKYKVILKNE